MNIIHTEYNKYLNNIRITTIRIQYTSQQHRHSNYRRISFWINCWEAVKEMKTIAYSEYAADAPAIDDPLKYARLYLEGNMQVWIDAEDSLEL